MDASIIMFEKLRPIAKDSVKDPDMCDCVKNLVMELINFYNCSLMTSLMMSGLKLWMKLNTSFWWKSKILISRFQNKRLLYASSLLSNSEIGTYTVEIPMIEPFGSNSKLCNIHNNSNIIFRSWWFWTLVSAIPFYGISQFFYVFHFLMMDKTDEF